MKYLLTIIYFMLLSFSLLAQEDCCVRNKLEARFDERVELLSLVARLAGSPEYCSCVDSTYAASADAFFAPVKSHEAVGLYMSLRRKYGISYDAVAAFANHICILSVPCDQCSDFAASSDSSLSGGCKNESLIVWDDNIRPGSDDSYERWPDKGRERFLSALNDFYRVSRFREWYLLTSELRHVHLSKEQRAYDMLNMAWYRDVFGSEGLVRTGVTVSLFAGQNNYGLSWELKDGTKVFNPVYGIWKWNDLMVVIHEFCHPYCNPLIDNNWNKIAKYADKAWKDNSKQLKAMAYGSPKIMMYETLVRAYTILYIKENLPDFYDEKKDALFESERLLGFALIEPVFNYILNARQDL